MGGELARNSVWASVLELEGGHESGGRGSRIWDGMEWAACMRKPDREVMNMGVYIDVGKRQCTR